MIDPPACIKRKQSGTNPEQMGESWIPKAIGYPCTELIPTFSTKSQLQVSHKRAIKLFLMIG